jgi:outer membrane protein OmpA-like peptidoglycan-associated protein
MQTENTLTRYALAAIASTAVLLSGCAGMDQTQRSTLLGAGVGAAVGGLVNDGRGAVVGAGVGALGGYAWSKYMERKRFEMERATRGTGVTVMQTADNRLQINAPSDISFATNSAEIRPSLRPVLDQFTTGLTGEQGLEIVIVGHTDSTGSDAINDPLSLDRAQSVRNYLAGRGIYAGLMRIEGRGSHQPKATNETAEGRAINRRVEIYLGQRTG